MKRNNEYFRGCLIGGAVGDALGWPVEFLKYNEIIGKYGQDGIKGLRGEIAEITDDTQMTLFTAEGILRAETRGREKGICDPATVVYYAYKRWLATQGYDKQDFSWIYDGWIFNIQGLHARRAPGNSCISALLSGEIGTIEKPINSSKGCGGVMRVAPVGLFYSKEKAFKMAVDFAALTHGHPSGYLSAGALAHIIACIIENYDIEDAVNSALLELKKYKGYEECYKIMEQAVKLSKDNINSIDAITKLGEGWIGEEALAISIYCTLKYKDDFNKALIIAVNHDGDSDSTGAITGNMLGAYLGDNAIPTEWKDKVELRNEIYQIADDLLIGYDQSREWFERYPGY